MKPKAAFLNDNRGVIADRGHFAAANPTDWLRAIIMGFDHHTDPQIFNRDIPFGRSDFCAAGKARHSGDCDKGGVGDAV